MYCLLVGESMGWIGCSSPSSKLDFMWYFLAGVLGDAELALDSFGEDAIRYDMALICYKNIRFFSDFDNHKDL